MVYMSTMKILFKFFSRLFSLFKNMMLKITQRKAFNCRITQQQQSMSDIPSIISCIPQRTNHLNDK